MRSRGQDSPVTRVLIVDDDPDVRTSLGIVLRAMGYETLTAADGAQVLACIHAEHVDVLVTDVFMPERDGIEMIAQVRREFPGLKIIAMSGGGGRRKRADYLEVARRIGADATLSKPFDATRLLLALRDVLGDSR